MRVTTLPLLSHRVIALLGVLVHQCLVQPTSDGQPTLGNGDWCLGHLAFGVLGSVSGGRYVGGQTQVS
jgi:hypothetical protein